MRHIGHTSLNKTGPGAVSLRDQRPAMALSQPYQLLMPFLGTNPAARSLIKANYSDPEWHKAPNMQSMLQQTVLMIEHDILQMGFNGFMGTSVGADINTYVAYSGVHP